MLAVERLNPDASVPLATSNNSNEASLDVSMMQKAQHTQMEQSYREIGIINENIQTKLSGRGLQQELKTERQGANGQELNGQELNAQKLNEKMLNGKKVNGRSLNERRLNDEKLKYEKLNGKKPHGQKPYGRKASGRDPITPINSRPSTIRSIGQITAASKSENYRHEKSSICESLEAQSTSSKRRRRKLWERVKSKLTHKKNLINDDR